MPVSCSTAALSGADGLITFKPAGTDFCLLDNSDFPAGDVINVPTANDFHVGDPVVFDTKGTSVLDTALTAGTVYFVVARTVNSISVSATKGGAAITLNGDGGLGGPTGGVVATMTPVTVLPTTSGAYGAGPYNGIATTTTGAGAGLTVDVTVAANDVTAVAVNAGGTGYSVGDTITVSGALLGGASPADDITLTVATASAITAGGNTPGSGNHIELAYGQFDAVCQVTEWSLDLSRETVDTTTLPCAVGAASKYAQFRTQTGGYASGEGSITVLFTADQGSLANRLMANAMLKNSTAYVKLYVNAVSGAGAALDDSASSYFEGQISLQGFSLSVNPDDATSGEISFSLSAQPKAIFGVTL